MKNILIVIVSCFGFSFVAVGQNNDSIQLNQISLNTVNFPQTESSIVSILGNPDSINNYYNEIDSENWLNYNYSGNSLYFFNTKLVDFELRNGNYYFINPNIKVGNSVVEVNVAFPNSYLKRRVVGGLGFVIINILMADGTLSDTFVVINYSISTNTITSIHLGEY